MFVPQALQTITLTDTGTGTTLFGGMVTTPTFKRMGPLQTRWQLDCRDWTYLADNAIVFGDFVGQTADEIAVALIAQVAWAGLTVGTIQPAPTIDRVQINYLTLSTAMQTLARLASVSSDYGWFVDYNQAVHFFSQAQTAAPTVTVTDNLAALPTTTTGGYDESGFSYVWDGTTVRSACIVRGGSYTGPRMDTWVGDGGTTQWVLTLPLDTAGTAPLLTVGGVVQGASSFWVPGVSSGTQPTTGYQLVQASSGVWSIQSVGITAAPGAGVVVSITYPFLAPVIVRVDNAAFEAAHAGLPNGGVFEMYVEDSSVLTLGGAQARAQAEVLQYGVIQERVTLKVAAGFLGHISGGDVITFVTSFVPDSGNGYAAGFTDSFLVISVGVTGVAMGYREYGLQAIRV